MGAVPCVAELMRIPPGDRVLLLKSLARFHGDRLEVMESKGSKTGASRHRRLLRQVACMARITGLDQR